MAKANERRGGGGKLLGLGILGGLVALVIAYFGNCVPGFGVGGSSTPKTTAPAKAEEAPAKAAAAVALAITVDGENCRRGDEAPVACPQLCRAMGSERKTQKIEVDGTLGTHAAVEALRKCLAVQGFRDVVVRAE